MFRIFLLLVFLFFSLSSFVYSLDVVISPEQVRQGEAFSVKITSTSGYLPEATIEGHPIYFHQAIPDVFTGIAFIGLEQPPGVYSINLQQGNMEKTVQIKVLPSTGKRIYLTVQRNKVFLTPEDEKRASRERKRMKALWSKHTEQLWHGSFVNPLQTEVSAGFGLVRVFNGKKESIHRGVDYRGKEGLPIEAINSGMIVLVDDQFFGGKTVMINHGEGIFSVYMHLSRILVEEGQYVNKSDVIGNVGSTGRATGPHLHLSVKWNGMSVNPLSLFHLPL